MITSHFVDILKAHNSPLHEFCLPQISLLSIIDCKLNLPTIKPTSKSVFSWSSYNNTNVLKSMEIAFAHWNDEEIDRFKDHRKVNISKNTETCINRKSDVL